jgi:hypothetical protein
MPANTPQADALSRQQRIAERECREGEANDYRPQVERRAEGRCQQPFGSQFDAETDKAGQNRRKTSILGNGQLPSILSGRRNRPPLPCIVPHGRTWGVPSQYHFIAILRYWNL